MLLHSIIRNLEFLDGLLQVSEKFDGLENTDDNPLSKTPWYMEDIQL